MIPIFGNQHITPTSMNMYSSRMYMYVYGCGHLYVCICKFIYAGLFVHKTVLEKQANLLAVHMCEVLIEINMLV